MSRDSFLAAAAVAAVAAASVVAAPAAHAVVIVQIPSAVATTPYNSELSLSDTYTSLPVGQLQPFAASAFSLSFYLPAQATYTDTTGNDPGFAIGGLNGFYENNGQTEFFGGATAIFDVGLNTGLNGFSLSVPNLLVTGDVFDLTADTSTILFDNTRVAGATPSTYDVTFPTSTFTVTGGSAFYAPPLLADPGTTLGATGSGALVPVPEPSSLALLLTGIVGLAAAVPLARRRRAG